LLGRRPLPVRERPLVATGEAALRYLRLDHEAALEHLSALKDACRRVRGDFVLDWRSTAVSGRAGRLLYERVLDARRRAGKRITSRIVSRPVSTIASRSIPSPRPPVGGMPYESAST